MKRIALLIQPTALFEDGNYLRFANALAAQGRQVDVLNIDSLRLLAGRVHANGTAWVTGTKPGQKMPDGTPTVIDHDLVWLLGLGERSNFLDKYQLLYALPSQCLLINSLTAIMHLKSKYFLASRPERFPNPETHASTSASELISIIRTSGGQWIVKPPAGSLGRDVYLTHADDPGMEALLATQCGEDNRYVLLQRYVPEIEKGEKRILFAGGQIIDQYRRIPGPDHRTNLSQGATAEACELTPDERSYCRELGETLLAHGAWFAGIDLAWPWLIEINVINPGGITTIESLTGVDRSEDVVNAVMSAISRTAVVS